MIQHMFLRDLSFQTSLTTKINKIFKPFIIKHMRKIFRKTKGFLMLMSVMLKKFNKSN